MFVFQSFDSIRLYKESVITIGTFDGVHRGHQKILDRLSLLAKKENLRPVVITFDPHPQIVLQTKNRNPIFLLSSISERLFLFEKFGIENVVVVPFTNKFSEVPPKEFILNYLVKQVGLSKILIGYDHSFGKDREGNATLLKELSKEYLFEVEQINPFQDDGTTISSTKIRKALQDANLDFANKMLGYDYFLEGIVVEGEKRGKKLGFPTANIVPTEKRKLLPSNGVYFTSINIKGKIFYGMTNIGIRPTFNDIYKPVIEMNIFDFDSYIYKEEISLTFLKFIRHEIKFPDVNSLIEQLILDNEYCQNLKNNFYN